MTVAGAGLGARRRATGREVGTRVRAAAGLLFAGILGLSPMPAAAALITVSFSGTITAAQDVDGISDGSVTAGTPFSGSVTFDDSDTDGAFTTPPASMSAQVGSYSFFTVPAQPGEASLVGFVQDSGSFDLVEFITMTASALGPLADGWAVDFPEFGWHLADSSGSALDSPAFDSIPWDLAPWDETSFSFHLSVTDGTDLAQFTAQGTIDVLSAVPVPEPSAFVSIVGAAALLALRRRVRR